MVGKSKKASRMRYRLFGSIGSPYALKLRSLMRYKRLAFDWRPATLDWIPEGLPHPPLSAAANREIQNISPRVVPVVYFPRDNAIRNESTTIAYLLDKEHPERAVIPSDPGLAFLSHLLEDMADEWLVKIAFQYRWGNAEDAAHKSRIVTGEFLGGGYSEAILLDAAKHFAERQQSRMPLVGCTAENATFIANCFQRLLAILAKLDTETTFLFGASPTLADFGFYGQLQSLATDPSPWRIMRERAPGVFTYLQHLEDASGIEPAPMSVRSLGAAAIGLLKFAAAYYLPYLQANAEALQAGRPEVSLEVDGMIYRQAPFKYHGKCLRVLRDEYAAIPARQRSDLDDTLRSVGALVCFRPTDAAHA
jgi:glutathione S-transferase